jgi:hypothetical protein
MRDVLSTESSFDGPAGDSAGVPDSVGMDGLNGPDRDVSA